MIGSTLDRWSPISDESPARLREGRPQPRAGATNPVLFPPRGDMIPRNRWIGAVVVLLSTPSFAQSPSPATQPHPLVEPTVAQIRSVVGQGPFRANWQSLERYEIPQWYKDAKFGIFIHWGAYSVPAYGSEWYPRQMYIDRDRRGDNFFAHHVDTYGPQKEFGYKDFIPQFKAEKFDAAQWAKLFKATGARYVIPVAEHHDGFPMYDCSFTRWDASQMGPERDVIGELAVAVRKEGMKFGVSSHRAFNWMFYVRDEDFDNADPQYADLYGRPMPFLFQDNAWDYKSSFPPQDQQFKDDWLARSCELVDKYQPDVFWFDFGITPKQDSSYQDNSYADHLKEFAAYYYNQSSQWRDGLGIINYKFDAFPESAAVLDKERSKMAEIRKPFWQTDTAVSSSSWGYTKNQRYKTPDRLVDDLVDIVSKNGCLLLNVGPRADGTIPDEDQAILKAIGGWLKVNGEAIYDTTYWKTFGEGPTTVSTGHVSESKDKPFTAADLRFTTRDGVLYAIGMAWPADNQITVKTLARESEFYPGTIAGVTMLGSDEKLVWSRDASGLSVQLPEAKPSEFAYVLKVTR
jgi:alpha-L-fucosidase